MRIFFLRIEFDQENFAEQHNSDDDMNFGAPVYSSSVFGAASVPVVPKAQGGQLNLFCSIILSI